MSSSTLGSNGPIPTGSLRFDLAGPNLDIERQVSALRAWARPLTAWVRSAQRSTPLRRPAHAVLADASGVWSWTPEDRYAPACRHADVRDWMDANPDTDIRLWVSGDLMHGLDAPATPSPRNDALLRSQARQVFVARHGHVAATWPLATWHDANAAPGVHALAGIDLEAICHHGMRHGVRLTSVLPWWHHAFVEAKRCVPRLEHAATAHVWVVEGRLVARIVAQHGVLSQVRRVSLREATIAALRTQMERPGDDAADEDIVTVVLGQGLADGGNAKGLDGLVLGRLDGDQPPQWLRPCTRNLH